LKTRPHAALRFVAIALSVAAGLITFAAAGCGGGGGGGTPQPTPTPGSKGPGRGTGVTIPQPGWTLRYNTLFQQTQKKWTFLVYMNGANDLEEFGSLNINQMEKVGSGDDINLVVQFKRIAGHDTSNGDWRNTRRYYVDRDDDFSTVTSTILSEQDNLDAGDWRTLQDFVQWGIQTFPAEHYALVVWNHGAGWRSVEVNRMKAATRGVSYDDSTDNHIDTIDIPRAIDMGSGKKWDLLVFDASLMQMIEVAYEIRDKATYIVGSEESPPGAGYPYDRFLSNLAAHPDEAPVDFGKDIAQQTIDSYGADSSITQSVLDTSKVADIVGPVDSLGQALFNVKNQYSSQIVAARENAENYAYDTNRDLLDFVRFLTQPPAGTTTIPVPDQAVMAAANRVTQAVNAALIKNVHGSQHPHSNGIAVFLPSPSQYTSIDIDQANGFGQRYSLLSFAKIAPNWVNFLQNGPR
jgi:hypothetical protein